MQIAIENSEYGQFDNNSVKCPVDEMQPVIPGSGIADTISSATGTVAIPGFGRAPSSPGIADGRRLPGGVFGRGEQGRYRRLEQAGPNPGERENYNQRGNKVPV